MAQLNDTIQKSLLQVFLYSLKCRLHLEGSQLKVDIYQISHAHIVQFHFGKLRAIERQRAGLFSENAVNEGGHVVSDEGRHAVQPFPAHAAEGRPVLGQLALELAGKAASPMNGQLHLRERDAAQQ